VPVAKRLGMSVLIFTRRFPRGPFPMGEHDASTANTWNRLANCSIEAHGGLSPVQDQRRGVGD